MKNVTVVFLVFLLFCITLGSAADVLAEQAHIWDKKVDVKVQSRTESDAHLLDLDNGTGGDIDVDCPGNRFYIEFEDKELLAAALSAEMKGWKISIAYRDNQPARVIAGHVGTGVTCKVVSIFNMKE